MSSQVEQAKMQIEKLTREEGELIRINEKLMKDLKENPRIIVK